MLFSSNVHLLTAATTGQLMELNLAAASATDVDAAAAQVSARAAQFLRVLGSVLFASLYSGNYGCFDESFSSDDSEGGFFADDIFAKQPW